MLANRLSTFHYDGQVASEANKDWLANRLSTFHYVRQVASERNKDWLANRFTTMDKYGEIFNRCRETEFNSLQTTSGYLIFT